MVESYNDPEYTVTRQLTVLTTVGNTGATKFQLYANAVMQSASATVITAGTSTGLAGNLGTSSTGYSIVFGTTTAGVIITGSDTAGSLIGPFALTGTVPVGTPVQVLHGTETTGVFNVTLTYKHVPNAQA